MMARKSDIILLLCAVIACCQIVIAGRRRNERDSNRSQSRHAISSRTIENTLDIKQSLQQLEVKLNNKVIALEHKLSWKINDRIRKVNHTVEVGYLDRMLHLVNEELTISLEQEEIQKQTIVNLQEIISQQDSEITQLKNRLQKIEDIVLNLTTEVEDDIPNEIKPISGNSPDIVPPQYRVPTSGNLRFSDYPSDCQSALQDGEISENGVHFSYIRPWLSDNPFEVRCQVQENAGWTVIQRRFDGSVDFFKGWRDYRNGFGTFRGEFWLGLQRIYELTNQGDYKLRIELSDWDDNSYWAEYEHFRVEDEDNLYRLHVHGFTGTAGDSLTRAWENHNGRPFSTFDNDNDLRFYDNCASEFQGAWWFTQCFESHLNGKYYHKGEHDDFFNKDGIQWNTLHLHKSLRAVQMMILPHAESYVEPPLTDSNDSKSRVNG